MYWQQIHGETLSSTPSLKHHLPAILSAQEKIARRLTDAFHNSVCLMEIVRNTPF